MGSSRAEVVEKAGAEAEMGGEEEGTGEMGSGVAAAEEGAAGWAAQAAAGWAEEAMAAAATEAAGSEAAG